MTEVAQIKVQAWRWWTLYVVLALALLSLVLRLGYLQVLDQDRLVYEGDKRAVRTIKHGAQRGPIIDSRGYALAVSTPVISLWVDPAHIESDHPSWPALWNIVGAQVKAKFDSRLMSAAKKRFIYLTKQLPPQQAQQILALKIPGIYKETDYKRFYPAGEITSHLVGFTDQKDEGQEGLELSFDRLLQGQSGSQKILKDLNGNVVRGLAIEQLPKAGSTLQLSLDMRLQYLAYRELKSAVNIYGAKAGSIVLLDARTGDVLALVNQPSYNPNNRRQLNIAHLRNRAVTDLYEPGSTVKPFTVAAALESELFNAQSIIDTNPGYLFIGSKKIKDPINRGKINLSTIITKSSQVGTSKLALALGSEALVDMFHRVGLAMDTGSGFPGEAMGLWAKHYGLSELETASLSYGYALAVTPLQLARAYTAFANQGQLVTPSFVKYQGRAQTPKNVMSAQVAGQILTMLETVVQAGGTAQNAEVESFRVAGKTGTSQKIGSDGRYVDDRHHAWFVGVAPVSNPRLVMAVLIDESSGALDGGGAVAAPVFARVMAGALRLLGIVPDQLAEVG